MEWSLVAAMRSLIERGELCRQMAEKAKVAGDHDNAAQWTAAMDEARERAVALRDLLEREWTHPSDAAS
jgi:two-component system chemotaxis response regulator CheB